MPGVICDGEPGARRAPVRWCAYACAISRSPSRGTVPALRRAARSRRCALLVALATTASGAAAPAHAGVDAWRVSALPVAANEPSSFSEPGITAGTGGLLVANASTANSGTPATFWLSSDGGRSWGLGATVGPSTMSTGDSDAAIGGDGTIYALVLGYGSSPSAQPTNPSVEVFHSRDGRRWAGPASFPPPHGVDQPDRPWLVASQEDPGRVLMFNSEGGGNIVAWSSTDHGASFQGPVPVTGGTNGQAGLALGSRPIVDPSRPSHMYLFYETAAGAASPVSLSAPTLPDLGAPLTNQAADPAAGSEFPLTQLWLAETRDAGSSWSNRLVLDAATAFSAQATLGHLLPATAVDAAGHLYAAVSVRATGSSTQLFMIDSTDHGADWSAPQPIESDGASNVMPALTATARGHVVVSWYASDAPDFSDPRARWREMVASSADALAPDRHFTIVRLGGPDPVHVGGIDNAGAVGSDLGADWTLRDFQSVTADDCGHPHVIWASDVPAPRTYTAMLGSSCPAPHATAPRHGASRRGHRRRRRRRRAAGRRHGPRFAG